MLQVIVDWFTYFLLRLSPETHLGAIINFFIYDSIKILLLLSVMISLIGFLRTFLPPRKIKEWLSGKKGVANLFASLFGAITPFCSCSSIPIFFGFLRAGIPLGVTFSFLIASPLINEYLVVLMLAFFGWKITLLYILSGISLAIGAGLILGRMNLERHLVEDLVATPPPAEKEAGYPTLKSRISFGMGEGRSIVKKIWLWILLGVAIGSLIHNYIPRETIQGIISKMGAFSVPAAAFLGVPMYGNCAAIVPIAVALFRKGIPLGTALAFMMATSALSFPEAVMLRRAMKLPLIAIFFGITTLGIIITGYLFNILQKLIA